MLPVPFVFIFHLVYTYYITTCTARMSFDESVQRHRHYLRNLLADVNITVQDLSRQDARLQDLYSNISEIKLSITSLF